MMGALSIPILVLGVLLAASISGNAWLLHSRDGALQAEATAKQLNADTAQAAKACSDSVDHLAEDGKARSARLEKMIGAQSGRIQTLQRQALDAQRAKPDDPKDLCGSLERYLRAQIRAEGTK
jgi:hypothetical protein